VVQAEAISADGQPRSDLNPCAI